MRAMTVEALRSLIAHQTSPCVSIYMPTRRGGSNDDRAQLAGHVREARKLLMSDRPKPEVDAILSPISELDGPFWQEQLDGLALFRARDFIAHYALPNTVEPLTVVADSFHIRPMLQFLQSNQRYFLLNLSLNRASFFKGNAMGLVPVEVPNLPKSMADAVGAEHPERNLQSHSSSREMPGKGMQAQIFHGQGKLENVQGEEVLRYFRAVDKALWEVLRDETAPLILAATSHHHPVYASVTRYAHLLRGGPLGNFDNAPTWDMHAKAWPVVQEHLVERENEVLEHYDKSIKRRRAADSVDSVAEAAVQGRVRELLVERGAQLWGRLDPTTGAVERHDKQKDAYDDDVLDDISEAVILRGGEVYAFDKARMPTKSPIAATLRW